MRAFSFFIFILGFTSLTLSQSPIGTFTLKSTQIQGDSLSLNTKRAFIRDTYDTTIINIKIDSVRIYITNGCIWKIYAHTDVGIFHNNQTVIPVTNYYNRLNDKLTHNQDENKYVEIGDLLDYQMIGKYNTIPDDIEFTLKASGSDTTIKKSSLLNIDLKVFSDLLGVFNHEPNGLVQTEGELKLITLTRNFRNLRLFPFHYIEPYFNYSKLDSAYSHVSINPDSSINRMNILQRSNFTFGVKANTLKYYFDSGSFIELNIGFQYNQSSVYSPDNKTKNTLSLNSLFFESAVSYRASKTIHFRYTPTFYLQSVDITLPVKHITNLDNNWVLRHEFSLNFSISRENKNNMVFVRFNMFRNLTSSNDDYNQLQIGYFRSLSDLTKKIKF